MSASDGAELDRLAHALAALLAGWWLRYARTEEPAPHPADHALGGSPSDISLGIEVIDGGREEVWS
jgi:hypothetical protein